jgi:hypothetical protein
MRITEAEYQALMKGRPIAEAKKPKYRNTKVEIDGLKFDSKKEAAHYHVLKLRERAGEIHGLELHPKFSLDINGIHICNYVADFSYYLSTYGTNDMSDAVYVVEDVKSAMTRKLPVYRLKMKMMKAIHGIIIQEI